MTSKDYGRELGHCRPSAVSNPEEGWKSRTGVAGPGLSQDEDQKGADESNSTRKDKGGAKTDPICEIGA